MWQKVLFAAGTQRTARTKCVSSGSWYTSLPLQYAIFLNICSSAHRNSRLKKFNKMQQYADIYLLLNYSTCFGRPSRQSSGVHKTVVAASGTDHTVWGASFFKRDQRPKHVE